jgi:hypothetical protein
MGIAVPGVRRTPVRGQRTRPGSGVGGALVCLADAIVRQVTRILCKGVVCNIRTGQAPVPVRERTANDRRDGSS